MDMLQIIEKKKNGQELTQEEINYWIEGYSADKIPDYQVSALLMAIRFMGMTKRETYDLTQSMMNSGRMIDLKKINGITVDKHSTGGVGDKTSMVLCPMVAALGVKVAKMSGRGLGFTGGTLDKLESIPGLSTELQINQFIENVNKNGLAIIGQSRDVDLADKKLYALRDVTGTVDSVPLIASSIMSKKLACGCDCILLDVKYGSGSFMKTKEEAEKLARLMVEIGNYFGKNVRAEITSMAQPLGKAIGNILEVKEAVDTLHGNGPADFTELCISSGATILLQTGLYSNRNKAKEDLNRVLHDESAFKYFRAMIRAQGGDATYIDNPEKFPKANYTIPVRSVKAGYISAIDTMALGVASMRLGAGRENLDDQIDTAAGIVLNKKLGEKVAKGDILLTMYSDKPGMNSLLPNILNGYDFSDKPVEVMSVVEERIGYNKEEAAFVVEKE